MKRHLVWCALLVAGVAAIVATYTPILDVPQCPPHGAELPDVSRCIIGANIGAGLARILGIVSVLVGGLGLLVSLALGGREWRS